MPTANVTRKNLATLLVTAGATAAFGKPVRSWLTSHGRLDLPNHRSSHTVPVPRGGGIAALLGASTAALVIGSSPPPRATLAIVGLGALGWLDDVTGDVPAAARLAGQLAAGALALSRNPQDSLVAAGITAGVVNVFNFMDGINGISALTATVWGINAILVEEQLGQLATLGALIAGAGLGFLPHNLVQSRMFLGDVGSYAFGAAMAAGILSQDSWRGRYQTASPLALYGLDAGLALLSRARQGHVLTDAHRDHIYQRLADSGRSHLTVATLHALGAVAMAAASRNSFTHAIWGSAAVAAGYVSSPIINRVCFRQVSCSGVQK